MHNQFKAVSLSYKNTPVDVREMVAFDEAQSKQLLELIEDYADISEALIISTCNRTEVYYSSPSDQYETIIKLIGVAKGISNISEYKKYFSNLSEHRQAVQHLFNVSIGLEAQVVGDLQIINQIKSAYQLAADQNIVGPFLHRLLHTIFFTNKRVVQETAFRDGAASVSYATVELIDELTSAHEKPNILVLGLGEIGEDVVRNLEHIAEKEVVICNRSIEKANALATEFGFTVMPFENHQQALLDADVIISSVRVDQPLITKNTFEDHKILSHKYLFDLSMPRSIDQHIEEINGLLLYNIDGIQAKATEALDRRLAAIPDVKAIIDEAINEFGSWSKEMEVSPVINKLKNALEEIRQNEMARYLKKANDAETKLLETATKNMMNKIIKLPVLQLKAACQRGEADSLIEVLNDLFNLEEQSEKIKSKG
ncbi:MAG: glutamyl-tRNA reductase [Reichenbachiella sp.]|uniref:glutamyl-tRNA reductase n=1 Tax=Reichenbachiella sp. TaxID=2184521 RepID=UPI0032982169